MRWDHGFIRRNFSLRERMTGEPKDGSVTLLPIDRAARRGSNWVVDGVIRMGLRRVTSFLRTGSNDVKVTRHSNSSPGGR